tara:strand:- start:413 stop:880 length:468 start_codon:yes stop_codon:yes gene_type:complete
MKITQIDRDVCKQLRVDMNEAIRSKLEEYGLEGEFLNGSYDDELVTFKVEIKVAGTLDKREKQLASSLIHYVKYLAQDLEVDEEEILNKEYRESSGSKWGTCHYYKLVGYNAKAKRYPLIMQNIKDGKRYRFPESFVRNTSFYSKYRALEDRGEY